MTDWKTIDSAPKDWSHRDLWTEERGRVPNCFWVTRQGDDMRPRWISCSGKEVVDPTHWMPLPSPPKETEG